MKRLLLLAACLAAAGCSDSKVVVRASLAEAGEPIVDLPVFLLPYDRQALMDSLAEASDDPEPTIPSALITQLESLNARERQLSAAGDSAVRVVRAQRAAVQARVDGKAPKARTTATARNKVTSTSPLSRWFVTFTFQKPLQWPTWRTKCP